MISLQTQIEGKKGYFGYMQDFFRRHGFFLCGGWDYHKGKFDAILWREKGETIYLRIPFHVLNGELDKTNTYIEFRTPYIIKHVVNIGLDRDENSLLSATGFNQFQKPLDKDGKINNKNLWQSHGEKMVEKIINELATVKERN